MAELTTQTVTPALPRAQNRVLKKFLANKSAVIGAVIVAPQMNYFTDRFINSIKAGQSGYMFMMDDRGMIIAHPEKENIIVFIP